MKVNEIFYSIQGESTFQGFPCLFIRTTGCNLRCSYCDTLYAFYDGYEISVDAILREVGKHKTDLIEITGGEPLIQKEVPLLIKELLNRNYTVLIETNGSIPINIIDSNAVRIMDIKCPSSGMTDRMDFENLSRLTEKDELKFVIGNRDDYEWVKKILRNYDVYKFSHISFLPVYGSLRSSELAEWILKDELKVRLQLQIQKYIWGYQARGR